MTFRELLNLYKNGELPDSEKPVVESEIDKFEALSDYVFSDVKEENLSASDPADMQAVSNETDFTKTIKKQIHNTFVKMGVIILIALIVFVLFFQFALPPIVDNVYYDPAKEITISPSADRDGDYTVQQMHMDFQVFADLNMPMENRTNVQATPLGYGKYNLAVTSTWQSFYDREKPSVSGQLIRDKLTFSIPDFIDRGLSFSKFSYTDNVSTVEELEDGTRVTIPKEKAYADEMDYFVNYDLKDYDDNERLKVAISFKEPITYAKMQELEEKYDIEQTWYAVATNKQGAEGQWRDLGFSLATTDWFHGYKNSEYPNLFAESDTDDAAVKQHFMSMLKYMSEREDFLSILSDPEYDMTDQYVDMYSNSYKYIKKNGFNLYGCVAFIQKGSLENMIENKDAYLVRFYDSGQ